MSLGALFVACQFADLLWPTLVLLGLERVEVQPGATLMTPINPDLPLTLTGTTRLGLGLWNSMAGTLAIELLTFFAGIVVYVRMTAARDRVGSVGLWSLVVFLLVTYIASTFGPPPPSARAVVWSAEAMWLLVAWAYWVDRHRAPV